MFKHTLRRPRETLGRMKRNAFPRATSEKRQDGNFIV